ncbi:MAG: ketoacyl-ACP synthase III [Bacteroidota bacterium]
MFAVISASGRYIPPKIVSNEDFLSHEFLSPKGESFDKTPQEIIKKFEEITTIKERRYVEDNQVCSDIAFLAAKDALESSGIDKESLDYIIVAHNWGDVLADNRRSDQVPSIASRVKYLLEIENPFCVPYDLPFGCPGWVQGLIQANYYIKAGDAKRVMVIGAETLSRIIDPHDRDSMLYADGAGAVILEAVESEEKVGICTYLTRSDTKKEAYLLWQQPSYKKEYENDDLFLKMHGHQLYRYALRHVPEVVKTTLDRAGLHLSDVKKVFIHQANAKMDDAILERIFRLYDCQNHDPSVMPLTVSWLGNSSVATVPTLYDLVAKGDMPGHEINSGDWVIFASVGAGMNINSIVYKVP